MFICRRSSLNYSSFKSSNCIFVKDTKIVKLLLLSPQCGACEPWVHGEGSNAVNKTLAAVLYISHMDFSASKGLGLIPVKLGDLSF